MIRHSICRHRYPTYHLLVSMAVGFLSIGSSFGQTQPAPPGLDLDKLAQQPGTTVTHSKRGGEDVTELRRNGVSIQVWHEGDKVRSQSMDQSGHGAVLCAWQIDIDLRAELDTCFAGKYPELRQDLDMSIAAINKFIVANSLTPISLAKLEATVAAEDRNFRSLKAKTSRDPVNACPHDGADQMAVAMAKFTHAQRQKMLDDLLSVPRLPVMAPCL